MKRILGMDTASDIQCTIYFNFQSTMDSTMTQNDTKKVWDVKDIKTFEDFDRFLTDNGITLVHDWSEMDWKNTAVEHIDDMMADILMEYGTGEDEEWNIAGLSANEIGMQLVNYVFNNYM